MRGRWIAIGLALAAGLAGLGVLRVRALAERRFQADLETARGHLLAGRHSDALRLLHALAAEHSESGEVQYLRGINFLARGRPDLSVAAWRLIAPGDTPHFGYAALHWAELDREGGRLAEAEDRLRLGLADSGPHRPRVRWALVELLVLEGRLDEARRLFAEGILEHPDPVEALRVLYKLEIDPFPIEAARRAFADAARRAPDDDRVWLGRAHLALRSGDLQTARSLLKSCLTRRPADPAVWALALELGVESGRPDEVAAALARLPASAVDDRRVGRLHAWAARRAGDRDGERRRLEALPTDPEALERLATMAIEDGRVDEAAALRRRRAGRERALVDYLRGLGTPDPDAARLARLARELDRRLDARFWEARAGGARPDVGSEPAGTAAEAHPDLVAALDDAARRRDESGDEGATPRFVDDARAVGLDFAHESGSAAGRLIPTVTAAGGVGLLDYDGDGWLDVYCVQSGPFPAGPASDRGGDRLFRNTGGTFEDVTERAGLAVARGYGHGVAVGDVDDDGHPDLFVTRWRRYQLLRNRGDGTFEDVTDAWGLGGDRDWPTSAVLADLDADGDADLYVCHYLAWDEDDPRTCVDPADPARSQCNPRDFPALPDHLFRNDGGRFVDATEAAGIVDREGRGFGVQAADLDGDGRVDLHVANDMTADSLFLNRGGLRFEEVGLEAGIAGNEGGGYQAGMGVACGDVDGDGRVDLAVTNFYGESTTLFRNLGKGLFADQTAAWGLKAASRFLLGFGVAFLDVDNDGRLDLLTANGHVHDGRPQHPWAMPLQLLRGVPGGRFVDVSRAAGPPFQTEQIARGLAPGDLDHDGRVDAVVHVQDAPLIFLHNRTEAGHGLTLALEGTTSHRDAIGAVATVVAPDGTRRMVQRVGGGSFQSAPSPRLHVGLGAATRAALVEVRWPSGRVDRFEDLEAGAGYRLVEGDPTPRPLPTPPTGPVAGRSGGSPPHAATSAPDHEERP